MKTVKITEAKNNLSRYLEYVRRGGRVRILDRDTPVADLVPVELEGTEDEDDAVIASLVRRGLVRPGKKGPIPRDLLAPGPSVPGAVETFLEERRHGS
ncbi:MAG: type II toxin-antitoxin system Phd/YefM family antitoxin [Planctomycetes bacterium]|nr:type II toxin-antitoxin system Phd/YefM family antitoxin [Planctomycetota bacterium]